MKHRVLKHRVLKHGALKPHHTARLLDRYRVTDGKHFRLKDHAPADRGGGIVEAGDEDKLVASSVERLSELQTRLYAEDTRSMLVVLQAMDAAGKDGTIKHVMTGVNPQGIAVTSFKQPGPEDLAHGFLCRIHAHAHARGRIAIFNRSHYEDVLVTRVTPNCWTTCICPKRHAARSSGIAAWRTLRISRITSPTRAPSC